VITAISVIIIRLMTDNALPPVSCHINNCAYLRAVLAFMSVQ